MSFTENNNQREHKNYRDFLSARKAKLWLCGMSSGDNLEETKACIQPIIEYFDGLNWTCHSSKGAERKYLESVKGTGAIVTAKWCCRNDFSRNHYLWLGTMVTGDWFINIDSCERILPEFFNRLGVLLELMNQHGVEGAFLHGKRFMFKYNDFLRHQGNPHEGMVGIKKATELTEIDGFKNSEEYFQNLRPQLRDPYHFVDAVLRYYYCYPDSNHMLLGNENNRAEFERLEGIRQQFRIYCRELGIECSTKGLLDYVTKTIRLPYKMKYFLNEEKILNDWYRFHFLNHLELNKNGNLAGPKVFIE